MGKRRKPWDEFRASTDAPAAVRQLHATEAWSTGYNAALSAFFASEREARAAARARAQEVFQPFIDTTTDEPQP